MPTSPSTDNYYIGKGVVTIDGRDVGNVPELRISSDNTFLDHYSSREGVRKKDRSVLTETNVTLELVLDEITPENAAIFLFGGTIAAGSFELFAVAEITGTLVFTGTNSVGQKITLNLPNISLKPNGAFDLITEEWGSLPLTADVLLDNSTDPTYGTATFTDAA